MGRRWRGCASQRDGLDGGRAGQRDERVEVAPASDTCQMQGLRRLVGQRKELCRAGKGATSAGAWRSATTGKRRERRPWSGDPYMRHRRLLKHLASHARDERDRSRARLCPSGMLCAQFEPNRRQRPLYRGRAVRLEAISAMYQTQTRFCCSIR